MTARSAVSKKLLVVDVMHLAYRSFYAFYGNPLHTTTKFPTSTVYGVAATCLKMLKEEKPDYLAFCNDSREKTFRHLACPNYKSNRRELPKDFELQLPYMYRFLETFNVPILQRAGFEADDLIGSLAVKFSSPELQVCILSKDKDFMQLVNDNVCVLKQDMSGNLEHIDEAKVVERTGVLPKQMTDYLAIVGDSADNVQGVRGIGPKGAAALLAEFPDLETILLNLDTVKSKNHRRLLEAYQQTNQNLLAKQLVTIRTDLEIDLPLEAFEIAPCGELCLNNTELIDFCREMEFDRLLKRFM